MSLLFFIASGTLFGWVLSRSGASDYDFIQQMFLFDDIQLYGIIGTAVAVTAPGIWLLRRHGKSLFGHALVLTPKPAHRGNLIGGVMFGVGWAMTGMCPGPVLVNIGEGKMYAVAALVGVLVGTGAFGALYSRLAARLRLPALEVGTGDG